MKRLTALLYDQNRHNESKHFCQRCLHGYKTIDLLEKHTPECKGMLKIPTRTEMPKQWENKMAFKNYYKQMKAPYVVYADFECVLKKNRHLRDRQQTELHNKNWETWAMWLFLYMWSWGVMDRRLAHTLTEVKTPSSNFSDTSWTVKEKCAKTWQTEGHY